MLAHIDIIWTWGVYGLPGFATAVAVIPIVRNYFAASRSLLATALGTVAIVLGILSLVLMQRDSGPYYYPFDLLGVLPVALGMWALLGIPKQKKP
jgi:hypothetical protein